MKEAGRIGESGIEHEKGENEEEGRKMRKERPQLQNRIVERNCSLSFLRKGKKKDEMGNGKWNQNGRKNKTSGKP